MLLSIVPAFWLLIYNALEQRNLALENVARDARHLAELASLQERGIVSASLQLLDRLEEESLQRLALAAQFKRAIENDKLLLYCQPTVSLATRRVCGAEALVRWRHPTRGIVPPGEFVPLAERTGLIKPLANWVLEAAFCQGHAWR